MILHKKIPIKTDRKEETKAIYKLITVLLSKFPEDEGELPEIKSEKYCREGFVSPRDGMIPML